MSQEGLSPATASRLPIYARGLRELAQGGVQFVSSKSLAETTGLEAHLIRKDLSRLGTLGKRGVGYQVTELLSELTEFLRLFRTWRVAIAGCGRLGLALASYLPLAGRNFRLVAAFDCSARKIGTKAAGIEILPWTRMPAVLRERAVDMVIIATPPLAAQSVADLAVEGGTTLILNYAPTSLTVPEGVVVRNVDLADEMQALTLRITGRPVLRTRRLASPAIPWITQQ